MLDDLEVRRLILLTAERDPVAFEKLYLACGPLLMGVAHRIVGRREVAEEVVHDAFIRIWRSAASFNPMSAQPVAWMAAIARNRAIDLKMSAQMTRTDLVGDDAEQTLDAYFGAGVTDLADAVDARTNRSRLRRAVAQLRPPERQALVLAYDHGMSHRELAIHLQKPLGTVKAWVRRAVEGLRACVDNPEEERLGYFAVRHQDVARRCTGSGEPRP